MLTVFPGVIFSFKLVKFQGIGWYLVAVECGIFGTFMYFESNINFLHCNSSSQVAYHQIGIKGLLQKKRRMTIPAGFLPSEDESSDHLNHLENEIRQEEMEPGNHINEPRSIFP